MSIVTDAGPVPAAVRRLMSVARQAADAGRVTEAVELADSADRLAELTDPDDVRSALDEIARRYPAACGVLSGYDRQADDPWRDCGAAD